MPERRESNKPLQAPFQYFGGKAKIAPIVWRAFGQPHNYIEPFCGSAAVLLSRPADSWPPNKTAVECVNDMDGFVTNFWRVLALPGKRKLISRLSRMMNYPVSEIDLEARHRWLVRLPFKSEFIERMRVEPRYCSLQRAAWWCWGLCQWIGGCWCAGEWFGPGAAENHGDGVCNHGAKLPHLSGAGMGVHRQLSHMGCALGVHRRLSQLANAGQGEFHRRYLVLLDWMTALADRLRAVRVCCGDWLRVCKSPASTTKHGPTAVFLDPPYSAEAGRDNAIYSVESADVAHRCREWCMEHGPDPLMRIALCGYEGEGHEALEREGWRVLAWKAHGGYAHIHAGEGAGKANRRRERIWFSPHCIGSAEGATTPLLAGLAGDGAESIGG